MEQKFLVCRHCGNMVAVVKESGVPIICCGEPMVEVKAETADAMLEKHVPQFEVVGNVVKVRVGEVEHPMLREHYIEWVSIQTKQGNQRKELKPGTAPEVCFALCEGDRVQAVYAYCNIHKLFCNKTAK